MKTVLLSLLLASSVSAFAPTQQGFAVGRTSVVTYGLFDFFSEEAKAKRQAESDRLRKEQEEAQRAILERRLNPDKEADYFASVIQRRKKFVDLEDGRNVVLEGQDQE